MHTILDKQPVSDLKKWMFCIFKDISNLVQFNKWFYWLALIQWILTAVTFTNNFCSILYRCQHSKLCFPIKTILCYSAREDGLHLLGPTHLAFDVGWKEKAENRVLVKGVSTYYHRKCVFQFKCEKVFCLRKQCNLYQSSCSWRHFQAKNRNSRRVQALFRNFSLALLSLQNLSSSIPDFYTFQQSRYYTWKQQFSYNKTFRL